MMLFLMMVLLSSLSVKAQTITEIFGTGANQFSIEFVQIGNAGNAADTTGTPNPVGRVDYVFNLGKYEISRDMVDKANSAGGLGITLQDMTTYGGGGNSRPASGISWNEAARFVNWLNTSKGYQAAYLFSEIGANSNLALWSPDRAAGANLFRHKNAFYFLPSLDEWYKGAYGSPDGTWYNFPTGDDIAPAGVSGGTAAATAVFSQGLPNGPADITNAGGLSQFGTVGQGGNVWEWNESAFDGANDSATESRELRGGAWYDSNDDALEAIGRYGFDPSLEGAASGFRVAMVPEPSSLSLLLAGGAVLMAGRRRSLTRF